MAEMTAHIPLLRSVIIAIREGRSTYRNCIETQPTQVLIARQSETPLDATPVSNANTEFCGHIYPGNDH